MALRRPGLGRMDSDCTIMADYWLFGNGDRILLPDSSGLLLLATQPPPDPPFFITPVPNAIRLATIDPLVIKGSVSIAPTNSAFKLATAGPTISIIGNQLITPVHSEISLVTEGPAIAYGSVSITPDPALFRLETSVTVEFVAHPSVEITPEPVTVRLTTAVGLLSVSIGHLFTPEGAQIAIIWDPEEPLGG